MKIVLEIAVFSVEAAIQAIHAGADRIEYCENPLEGGTTPSYGSLKSIHPYLSKAPIFPIIRPRGGDFLYSKNEFNCIKEDLKVIRDLGFPGAVIGMLKNDGTVDIERTSELVALSGNDMELTFHRAFDRALDPFKALEAIIQSGCKRILTSGQVPNASDAIPLLRQLNEQANNKIIIMPGSGVRASNVKSIVDQTGVLEIHSSARKMVASSMLYQKESMKENLQSTLVDETEIQLMQKALQS
jgi:copper homeostasis protein